MLVLGGLLLVGFGLVCILARDHLWAMTQRGHRMEGVASERTEWWDTTTVLTGIGSIVFGAVVIGYALLNPQPSATDIRATESARSTTSADAVATFTARMTQTWAETSTARTATAEAATPTARP